MLKLADLPNVGRVCDVVRIASANTTSDLIRKTLKHEEVDQLTVMDTWFPKF